MRNVKQSLAMLAAIVCLMTAAGCAEQTASNTEEQPAAAATQNPDSANETVNADTLSEGSENLNADLTKADQNTTWDGSAVALTCSGNTVTPSRNEGLTVENGVVTITKGGDYVLSGTLDDGRIIIDLTDETEKVHLIFNGISISSSRSAPISVLQADKTVITLADGTENTLSDASAYTEFDREEADSTFPNACLASRDDLTINGGGKLTVTGNYHKGIHCKDDLKIVSGDITVNAVGDGVRGNDSVLMYGGSLRVTAGEDGIKSNTADAEGKGNIIVSGGTVSIEAGEDGMDAAVSLSVTGGTLDITAGGGSANAPAHADDRMGGGFGGGRFRDGFGGFQPTVNTANAADNGVSTKGIKADVLLDISGGNVTVDAADDAIHCNSTVHISGNAALTLASGDDGIHADDAVVIDGGDINITESYEGIEAYAITVNGGNVHLLASDDGFNASGGSTDSAQNSGFGGRMMGGGSGELYLSGGYVYVNAGGDGLDSNGNITMTGGTVIVCGPTDNSNGPLDSGDNQNTITVTGGTLIAVGSTGMMEVPESNYLAATNLNASAGTLIVVTDESGNVLAALETPKQAQGIVCSVNGMSDGYCIYTGGSFEGTLNADGFADSGSYSGGTLVASGSGGGSGMGGFGGGFGGGRGNGGGRGGNMTPPDGFEGNFDGNPPPPDGFGGNGMTPPDGFGGGHKMPPDDEGVRS